MALSLRPGETVVLTADAAAVEGTVDAKAATDWTANDGGAIVSLKPSGNTCTVGFVTAGYVQITATGKGTDKDGKAVVVSGAPFDVECLTPGDPAVTISAGDVIPADAPAKPQAQPAPAKPTVSEGLSPLHHFPK